VNSSTFKDLWNKIQGHSSTCPVFKYLQGLEFVSKKIQVLSSTNKDAWEPCAEETDSHLFQFSRTHHKVTPLFTNQFLFTCRSRRTRKKHAEMEIQYFTRL